jgi:hypothetical protein
MPCQRSDCPRMIVRIFAIRSGIDVATEIIDYSLYHSGLYSGPVRKVVAALCLAPIKQEYRHAQELSVKEHMSSYDL